MTANMVEDHRILDVFCKWFQTEIGPYFSLELIILFFFLVAPTVNLHLGRAVNPRDLEEGDDVYFECQIEANPKAYKVVWRHNVSHFYLFLFGYTASITGFLQCCG